MRIAKSWKLTSLQWSKQYAPYAYLLNKRHELFKLVSYQLLFDI